MLSQCRNIKKWYFLLSKKWILYSKSSSSLMWIFCHTVFAKSIDKKVKRRVFKITSCSIKSRVRLSNHKVFHIFFTFFILQIKYSKCLYHLFIFLTKTYKIKYLWAIKWKLFIYSITIRLPIAKSFAEMLLEIVDIHNNMSIFQRIV